MTTPQNRLRPSQDAPWATIASSPEFKTVQFYRLTDLYPVVGFRAEDDFILEEGGPEDGEHRKYPSLDYKPTHWKPIPEDLP